MPLSDEGVLPGLQSPVEVGVGLVGLADRVTEDAVGVDLVRQVGPAGNDLAGPRGEAAVRVLESARAHVPMVIGWLRPVVRTSSCACISPIRASIARGVIRRVRAAASSIASGSPSSLPQIPATYTAFVSVNSNCG